MRYPATEEMARKVNLQDVVMRNENDLELQLFIPDPFRISYLLVNKLERKIGYDELMSAIDIIEERLEQLPW